MRYIFAEPEQIHRGRANPQAETVIQLPATTKERRAAQNARQHATLVTELIVRVAEIAVGCGIGPQAPARIV